MSLVLSTSCLRGVSQSCRRVDDAALDASTDAALSPAFHFLILPPFAKHFSRFQKIFTYVRHYILREQLRLMMRRRKNRFFVRRSQVFFAPPAGLKRHRNFFFLFFLFVYVCFWFSLGMETIVLRVLFFPSAWKRFMFCVLCFVFFVFFLPWASWKRFIYLVRFFCCGVGACADAVQGETRRRRRRPDLPEGQRRAGREAQRKGEAMIMMMTKEEKLCQCLVYIYFVYIHIYKIK